MCNFQIRQFRCGHPDERKKYQLVTGDTGFSCQQFASLDAKAPPIEPSYKSSQPEPQWRCRNKRVENNIPFIIGSPDQCPDCIKRDIARQKAADAQAEKQRKAAEKQQKAAEEQRRKAQKKAAEERKRQEKAAKAARDQKAKLERERQKQRKNK